MSKPRIAVFTGPMPTIANTTPLVTGARSLRPQRLAAPVKVLVEAFSAHPLEAQAAHLYGPPDGWLDADGRLVAEEPAAGGTPVYEVELNPDDGLFLLPYVARRADGRPWASSAEPAAAADTRQTFLPDARRLYEEIERFEVGGDGRPVALSALADFDFLRAAPGGGYPRDGERLGVDYFPYEPPHLVREPDLAALARITDQVQEAAATGRYAGLQWLESSATVEETLYWLNLVIDTTVPIVGHAAQRSHRAIGHDGAKNILDGVRFILSGVWADDGGRDRLGAVLIVDEMVLASREVAKIDARPGGYVAVGGHGGVVADLGAHWGPRLTYVPERRHTATSELRLPLLPSEVDAVEGDLATCVRRTRLATKDAGGRLVGPAMPRVSLVPFGHFAETELGPDEQAAPDAGVIGQVERALARGGLAGLVVEGMVPYGSTDPAVDRALRIATCAGIPVVRVGRGHPGGMVFRRDPWAIAGDNLTANKARMLLTAALLRLGALPPARDPLAPTDAECTAIRARLRDFQDIFDTH
ncbi:asparaginase domain-containing protein [Streptomyces sp. NPDC001276]|uniref:asparaginase domain-containing protein n=1 Tax=Streptomyces sp. NPDC001276 TaxID=3364555 RepID=UPI0036A5071B